jgi:predicted nuclease of restriction endonuclease-like (RecB) superfamily
MMKKPAKRPTPAAGKAATSPVDAAFDEVVSLIHAARQRAVQAVNTELIDLYWRIGAYLHNKIEADGWAKGTVVQLASYLAQREPGIRGFSPQNLWRMRQFFEAYRRKPKLSALLRELPWSSNLHILTRSKRAEEREFYLRMATRNHWSVREVERQINSALFERSALGPPKVSPVVTQSHPEAQSIFKDSYVVEFLNLPHNHAEADLHRGLVNNLKAFLMELGRDFCFVGSEYPVQVGGRDFSLDLLFFHRGLNCLVAIELKAGRFEPEHLGKLNFYLEALDRDVRKSHEGPAIGVLLCATKDSEVVEYALSRSLSPALIAEYQTRLPDKKLLQAKLHEFYALSAPEIQDAEPAARSPRNANGRKA